MSDRNNIGMFEVESGKIRISDPCYKTSLVRCTKVINGKNGIWNAFISISDNCVSKLEAIHSDFLNDTVTEWVESKNDIGVDSGQVCIVDDNFYRKDEIVDKLDIAKYISLEKDGDKWYARCCAITEQKAGIMPYGCVSQSGYGDGSYTLYTKKYDNEIVAIKVLFIEEDN